MTRKHVGGKTAVSELKTLIRKLGGTPKGDTMADLLDELEDIHGSGGGGGDYVIGEITDEDMDEIFGIPTGEATADGEEGD